VVITFSIYVQCSMNKMIKKRMIDVEVRDRKLVNSFKTDCQSFLLLLYDFQI
jgi:hypothetical protein